MKKLLIGTLVAASVAFSAGFGSASTDMDKTVDNPFIGGKSNFLIATASESGSYYKAGVKMSKQLTNAYSATTDGSGQNLDLLSQNLVNVAFVQGDIFNEWKSKNPGLAEKFTVIITERTEHVHLITKKGTTEDDLQKKGSKVLVGLSKSGGAGSYRNMQLLEPNYIAEPMFGEIDAIAINDLKQGKITGIIRTAHVEPGDVLISKVLADESLTIEDLDDSDLNDKITLNGETRPIYNFVSQNVQKGMFAKSAKMLETRVYIVINNELTSRKQRAEIADLVSMYKTTLFN